MLTTAWQSTTNSGRKPSAQLDATLERQHAATEAAACFAAFPDASNPRELANALTHPQRIGLPYWPDPAQPVRHQATGRNWGPSEHVGASSRCHPLSGLASSPQRLAVRNTMGEYKSTRVSGSPHTRPAVCGETWLSQALHAGRARDLLCRTENSTHQLPKQATAWHFGA